MVAPVRTVCFIDESQEASEQMVSYDDAIPSVIARVILFLYTKTYEALEIPDVFQTLCSDPPELEYRHVEEECPAEERDLEESDEMDEDESTIVEGPQSSSESAPKAVSSDGQQTLEGGESNQQGSEEDKQAKREKMFKSLKVNAMVYKYADYLKIEELAKLASDRFLEEAKEVYLLSDFTDPLETLYEQLPPNDQGLRLRVTTFMAEKYEEVRQKPMIARAVDFHTDGFWKVCTKLMDQQKELHQRTLEDEVKQLVRTLEYNDMRCKHKSKVVFRYLTPEEREAEQQGAKPVERWSFDFTCRMCQMRYPDRK